LLSAAHSAPKTEKLLAQMMRLKAAKHLDPHKRTLIDNAYYACKPPPGGKGSASARRKAARLAATPPQVRHHATRLQR